jgi:hypothetical protein
VSRAGDRAGRRPLDFYETPIGAVYPLLEELKPIIVGRTGNYQHKPYVVDVGAGSGSLSQAVLDTWDGAVVDAAELNGDHAEALQAVRGAPRENGYKPQIMRIHWGNFLTDDPDWKWERGETWPGTPWPDLWISNPPYLEAQAFVERMLFHAGQHPDVGIVAALLRVGFVESSKRYEFWKAHPPAAMRFLVERPSFTGKGTDASAYAWMLWNTETSSAAVSIGDSLPPFGWYSWK